MYAGLEDPGQALTEEITKITGIDDQMLENKKIDWQLVDQYFQRSSLYVAHNAAFDRSFLERLPVASSWKGHWACSMKHIDWEKHGFKTRSLNYLAADQGFVNPFAHRALFDCATTFRLISGHTEELIRRSYLREFRILANRAPFELKDKLKMRKYRWDPQERVWFKDLSEDLLSEERKFLSEEIYNGQSMHEEYELT
jgi:DNA polymerase-3 subunit epsilon